jgi:hypothetical protein
MKRDTATLIASLVDVISHLDPDFDILAIDAADLSLCNQPTVHLESIWGIAPPWDWNIDQPTEDGPKRAWVTLRNVVFFTLLEDAEYEHAMRQIARHQKQTEGPPPWDTTPTE